MKTYRKASIFYILGFLFAISLLTGLILLLFGDSELKSIFGPLVSLAAIITLFLLIVSTRTIDLRPPQPGEVIRILHVEKISEKEVLYMYSAYFKGIFVDVADRKIDGWKYKINKDGEWMKLA